MVGWPDVVNGNAARFIGAHTVALAGLHFATGKFAWTMPFLFYEYSVRLIFGPKPFSAIAWSSQFMASPFKNKPSPAKPKRFATLCGTMFSGGATLFYYYEGLKDAKISDIPVYQLILGGLCCAAFMESAFSFCVGCKIYQALQYLGVVPKDDNCKDGVCRIPGAKEK